MTQEFDPKKSYLAVKAHEKMIAYVGFGIQFGDGHRGKEGVIKISSFQRPYGGGYLTLTFIIDTEDDRELKDHLKQIFNKLTQDSLEPSLGKYMQKLVKVSLDSLEEIPEWYIEELSIHFSSFYERMDVLIEEKLLPALKSNLSFSFDPVEWWPADKPVEEPKEASLLEHISLKALFRKWFKGQ
ncbi:MAG: hypothetical protein P8185_25295 [Deltaproteobacteria bacterium]